MTREQFLSKKPFFLASISGVALYEHPVYGDESPVIAVTKCGKVIETDFYETDDIDSEYIAYLLAR